MYAVMIRPDLTLNVRVMGPYRSHAIADTVRRRFDDVDAEGLLEDFDGNPVSIFAEVVELSRWQDIMRDIQPSNTCRSPGCRGRTGP